MDIDIRQLTQHIEDEIIKNLRVDVVKEYRYYEPCDSYKVILKYKDKVISESDMIQVPV